MRGEIMEYESTDKYMSSWVISSKKNGARFFLTTEDLATDIINRAHVERRLDKAEELAEFANDEYAWKGFSWQAVRIAEVLEK
jgi:hypothetical protein